MPVPSVSYPGVYIQEVESEVHTIVSVDTATTAFIGRALRGPVNEPVVIHNWADFERNFGGLWLESGLGYAVKQFFLNGGSKAVIVRLYHQPVGAVMGKAILRLFDHKPEPAEIEDLSRPIQGELRLRAKTPGAWGNHLSVRVSYPDPDDEKTFNLAVHDQETGETENFEGLTVAAGPNQIDKILNEQSKLLEVDGPLKDAGRPMASEPDEESDVGEHEKTYTWVKPQVAGFDVDKSRITLPLYKNGEPEQLPLVAKYPGAWGNQLSVNLTYPDKNVRKQLADKYSVGEIELFNLAIEDKRTGVSEYFENLTVVEGPRRVDRVLENDSQLIAVAEPLDMTVKWPEIEERQAPDVARARDIPGSDGDPLSDSGDLADLPGSEALKTGIYALEDAEIFNLLYIPAYKEDGVAPGVLAAAAKYCEDHRAFLLVDPPVSWISKEKAINNFPIKELSSANAAVFFPNIKVSNPLHDNQAEAFGPCGAIAGVFARTDATRGVWKAPAGLEATLKGVAGLTVPLTDNENGELNPLGINCLRQMPAAGFVVWGARTLKGDDRLASEWKYIPVRRTALFIEESLYRGTQWAVFEPNDEPLWSKLRLNIGVFMHNLFRQGAFQGGSPGEAYFVKCDKTTTTQADIDLGIVNILVGFAPLKPAEFVILYIQQKAGELAA
jgi:uncharacterized protein